MGRIKRIGWAIVVLGAILVAGTTTAWAQDNAAGDAQINYFEQFVWAGGPVAWFEILLSVVMVALAIMFSNADGSGCVALRLAQVSTARSVFPILR